MRPRILPTLAAACAVALTAVVAPAGAMVNGTHDDTHVAVGTFWVSGPSVPGGSTWICTGTLISPTVFVTASHCAAYGLALGGQASISLTATLPADGTPPADLRPATIHLNPAYHEAAGTDLYNPDVSVLTLAQPVKLPSSAFAQLPAAGLLDRLQAEHALRATTFTVLGYGSSSMQVVPKTGPVFPATNDRESATLGFSALDASVLHEDQRANAGYGGAGYGDSGGPSFLGTTNVIVGVTSTGDIPCYATNTAYRLDTDEARAFLGQYVPLP